MSIESCCFFFILFFFHNKHSLMKSLIIETFSHLKVCSAWTVSSSTATITVEWRTSSLCASSSALASCLRCWQGIKQRNSCLNWSQPNDKSWQIRHCPCPVKMVCLFEQEATANGEFHFLPALISWRGFIFYILCSSSPVGTFCLTSVKKKKKKSHIIAKGKGQLL